MEGYRKTATGAVPRALHRSNAAREIHLYKLNSERSFFLASTINFVSKQIARDSTNFTFKPRLQGIIQHTVWGKESNLHLLVVSRKEEIPTHF